MADLLNLLSSPVWWFSIVVVGIVASVIASYLKSFLDNQISKYSTSWRQRKERRQRERQQRIEKLRDSKDEQLRREFKLVRDTVAMGSFFVSGLLLTVLAYMLSITALILDVGLFQVAVDVRFFQVAVVVFGAVGTCLLLLAYYKFDRRHASLKELKESYEEPDENETKDKP